MWALLRRMAVNVLVALVSLLLVLGADPFGWDSATDGRVEEITQGIFSPFYDTTASAAKVTVVLIDEAYFTATGQPQPTWPLPVNDLLNRVLRPIVDAGPRAVFIDLSFPKAPREIAADTAAGSQVAARLLGTGIADIARQGVPIFIADGLTPDRTPGTNTGCPADFIVADDVRTHNILSDEFLAAAFAPRPGAAPAELTIVSAAWTGDTRIYPLAPTMIGPHTGCLKNAEDGKGFMLSPALALYQVYHRTSCFGAKALDQACADTALFDAIGSVPTIQAGYYKTFDVGAAARKPLSINWGHYVSPEFKSAFGNAEDSDLCFNQFAREGGFELFKPEGSFLHHPFSTSRAFFDWLIRQARSVFERSFRAMHTFFELLIHGGKQDARRCVYIDTISAGHMFDRLAAPSLKGIDEVFLKNRLVIVGVALPQARDNFVSPINGQIPGAYLHAAAVENLIHYGANFKTKESEWLELAVKFALIVLVSALFPEIWKPLRSHIARYITNRPLALVVATIAISFIAVIVSILLFWISTMLTNMPLGVLAVPMVVIFARVFTDFMKSFETEIKPVVGLLFDKLHRFVRALHRRVFG